MQAKDILQSDLLDIVFDDRNKEYGAYELRKTYNKRITTALSITALLLFLVALSSFIGKKEKKMELEAYKIPIQLTDVGDVLPLPPPIIPPSPIQEKEKVNVFLEPVPIEDELADPTPPENTSLENTRIDDFSQDGIDNNKLFPPENVKGLDVVNPTREDDGETVVWNVQEEASVDTKAWRIHLGRYLEPLLENAAEK